MSEEKLFTVNIDSPIAVYVQIENQVQFALAAGRIKPGDTLPSVKKMTDMLDVNPNTVTKAYRDLELMGLVRARRGVGVTATEKAPKLCKESVVNTVTAHLIDAVAECISCGLTAAGIRTIVSDTITSGCQPYETPKKK